MAITSKDIDAIFDGASAVVDATQNIVGAVSTGVNQVQNAFDNSRRNDRHNNPTQMNNGYAPYYNPTNYGYGYSEPDPRMQAPLSFVMTSNYSGYPSFYSTGGSNPYQQMNPYNQPNPYNQMNPYNQPIISGGGYYGFTDPSYGTTGGCNGGYNNGGGQKGGPLGWG